MAFLQERSEINRTKRSLVEGYEVLRDAFSHLSEYHLNKFNVSFEFKLISMVVSITALLIQAKEKKITQKR